MRYNDFSDRLPRPEDRYDIELDHNMDGNLDGEDVNTYIDKVAQGGPKSSRELLELQAAGCEIDAADLKNFVEAGGKLSGKDVLSFVANGGKLSAEDYADLKKQGVKFDSKQTIIMESAMETDLNGDGKIPGPHVAEQYLAKYETRPSSAPGYEPGGFPQYSYGAPQFPDQQGPYGFPGGDYLNPPNPYTDLPF